VLDPDGITLDAYGVSAYPTNALIDREGRLRYLAAGFQAEALDGSVRQLLGPP